MAVYAATCTSTGRQSVWPRVLPAALSPCPWPSLRGGAAPVLRPTLTARPRRSWGSGSPEEIISSPTVVDEDNGMGTMERRKTTGQILWIRGLTRLQTQVSAPAAGREVGPTG